MDDDPQSENRQRHAATPAWTSTGRPQAKDISDEMFLEAMDRTRELRPGYWVTRWDHQAVMEGHDWFARRMGEADSEAARQRRVAHDPDAPDYPRGDEWPTLYIPERVYLAKARKLIKRGLIDGCGCGCRGDFTRPEWNDESNERSG